MASRNRTDARPISGSGKGNIEEGEEDFSRALDSVGASVNGATFQYRGALPSRPAFPVSVHVKPCSHTCDCLRPSALKPLGISQDEKILAPSIG